MEHIRIFKNVLNKFIYIKKYNCMFLNIMVYILTCRIYAWVCVFTNAYKCHLCQGTLKMCHIFVQHYIIFLAKTQIIIKLSAKPTRWRETVLRCLYSLMFSVAISTYFKREFNLDISSQK